MNLDLLPRKDTTAEQPPPVRPIVTSLTTGCDPAVALELTPDKSGEYGFPCQMSTL